MQPCKIGFARHSALTHEPCRAGLGRRNTITKESSGQGRPTCYIPTRCPNGLVNGTAAENLDRGDPETAIEAGTTVIESA